MEEHDSRNYYITLIMPAIITGLMLRHQESGYSDSSMLVEAYKLANTAVDIILKENKK